MSFSGLFAAKWLRWDLWLATPWAILYLLLLVISEVLSSCVLCITEIRKTVYEVSGFDFEISENVLITYDCATE
jgi:hypothetical protein